MPDRIEGVSIVEKIHLYQCGDCHKAWHILNGPDGLLFCPFCGTLNSF